jgi:tRNA threonylcarbamoyladenosine biosynthesis protein TsaE
MQTTTTSAGETAALGRTLARQLKPGDVVALSGQLGSGKTCFVQGVCEALGVGTHVGSPTFTLINEYPTPFGTVVHVDLYRISSPRELAALGIQEYFTERCICLVEWPELAGPLLPPGHFTVGFRHGGGDTERVITIDGGRQ